MEWCGNNLGTSPLSLPLIGRESVVRCHPEMCHGGLSIKCPISLISEWNSLSSLVVLAIASSAFSSTFCQ